ncbi:MAG: ankyrin repeat domain-containing protein [Candidatus Micrarchaeota archaeon]|nr:ankyrin repeat domain-containing protein [Candidatus Micrarchaeota archaeon]
MNSLTPDKELEGFLELVEKHGINTRVTIMGDTLLHLAAARGFLDWVVWLVEGRNADLYLANGIGMLPLHIAAARGHLSVVRYMLEEKQMPALEKDLAGNTILHLAAAAGKTELVDYLIRKYPALTKMKNPKGELPIDVARKYDQPHIAERLRRLTL